MKGSIIIEYNIECSTLVGTRIPAECNSAAVKLGKNSR